MIPLLLCRRPPPLLLLLLLLATCPSVERGEFANVWAPHHASNMLNIVSPGAGGESAGAAALSPSCDSFGSRGCVAGEDRVGDVVVAVAAAAVGVVVVLPPAERGKVVSVKSFFLLVSAPTVLYVQNLDRIGERSTQIPTATASYYRPLALHFYWCVLPREGKDTQFPVYQKGKKEDLGGRSRKFMHDRIVCSRTGFLDLKKKCRPRRAGSVSPKDAIATRFGTTLQYSEVSEDCVCLQQYRPT